MCFQHDILIASAIPTYAVIEGFAITGCLISENPSWETQNGRWGMGFSCDNKYVKSRIHY